MSYPKNKPSTGVSVAAIALAITVAIATVGCAKTISQLPSHTGTTPTAAKQTKMLDASKGGEEASEASEAGEANEQNEAGEEAEAGKSLPASLVTASEQGEDMYDAAQAGDWQKVGTQMNALKSATQQLPQEAKVSPSDEKAIQSTIQSLDKAISHQDKLKTMENANEITAITTRISSQFNPAIPPSVSMLDYQGRALQLGASEKDSAKLKATMHSIQETWKELQPQVVAHGGQAEAQQFTALIDQTAKAHSPQQYGDASQKILDQVDVLEKVFTQHPQ